MPAPGLTGPVPSRPMTVALAVVGVALAAYLAAALAIWALQPWLVFHPGPAGSGRDPGDAGLDWRRVTLTTADGLDLAGWFVHGPRPTAPVVLFFHGNAGTIADRIETLATLHDAGAATLIIDYRGYGDSGGRPSEIGLYRDAEAAWRWLTASAGYAPGRIVVLGRSLGGAVAAELAARHAPAGLILEAAFTSLAELGGDVYPWLPTRLLARYRFDTAAALARTRCPVLIAHARDDSIVPFEHGRRLARIRPAATDWLPLEGDHNMAFVGDGRAYSEALGSFIARVTTASPGG